MKRGNLKMGEIHVVPVVFLGQRVWVKQWRSHRVSGTAMSLCIGSAWVAANSALAVTVP